ncbi:MAG: S41 family peptidase [Candidatus Vogelbacteria bacterium]|nr:S41 family peptidase [Candidatus Vogelbacteria bacterium]
MFNKFKKYFLLILFVLLPIISFNLGKDIGSKSREDVNADKVTYISNKDPLPQATADFSSFWKVWNIINERFVDVHATTTALSATTSKDISDQKKVYGAISGLVKSLGDPYTVFMPPDEAAAFQGDIDGSFQGVGMEVGLKNDVLIVISPLEGTPAKIAGIRPGDKIVKIDNKITSGMTVEEAVKLIRGPKGTKVSLALLREGESDLLDLKVTRDVINIPVLDIGDSKSVDKDGALKNGKGGTVNDPNNTGLRKDGVFVMRLYNFSAPSPELFRQALQKFVATGSNKLLLDLRGNPGGYLEAAVEMASWFLPSGRVVVSEAVSKDGEMNNHRSKGYNIFNSNLKMAILIDGGSASASEILAGALSEHGIAKLIGGQSFGKGSVQELVPVTSDTFVKVTIARWFTPNGNSISDHGLTPDIKVSISKEDIKAGRDPQFDRAIKYLLEGK